MAPYVENLLIFSGSQLEVLDIRVRSPDAIHRIPESALVHLRSLQRLSIRFAGYSANNDTLVSATEYIHSFFGGLPTSSHLASLSLRVDERIQVYPNAGSCIPKYEEFLHRICERLSCTGKWRRLNSCDILVNVQDGNSTEPNLRRDTINMGTTGPRIVSLLQANAPKAGQFRSSAVPLMG